MRRISTGTERLLTSAAVATAVLSYARELALARSADTVSIPIVRADGVVDVARLLLGPASQLVDVPDDGADVDLTDGAEVVADIERRIALLAPMPIVLLDALPEVRVDFDEYD